MSVWGRTKDAVVRFFKAPAVLNSVDQNRGWITLFGDTYTGAWQQDAEVDFDTVMANWTVWSCITLISSDIGKCSMRLMQKDDGIWVETESPAFSPVLRKPNGYQNTQQFLETWLISKLAHGNTYVLKERDQRGIVVRLHVLDPRKVVVQYSNSGDVFYQLMKDELTEVPEFIAGVPASEIIHDRFNCLFHHLQGLSPLYANGLAALQGTSIQRNSSKFFGNMSRPGGVLTAPGAISNETAQRLKDNWEANYTGDKFGKVAVLGDGLEYKPMTVTAVDSQLVEQMRLTAEMICSTFHVPSFKVGAGTIPAGQKVEDLNQIYYADCLHSLMDAVQNCLSEGLGLTEAIGGRWLKVMFDLDDLLKMDATSLINALKTGVDAAIYAPNEARRRVNLGPLVGGDTVYMQQQDFPLDQVRLNKIEQAPAPQPPAANDEEPMSEEDMDAEMEDAA